MTAASWLISQLTIRELSFRQTKTYVFINIQIQTVEERKKNVFFLTELVLKLSLCLCLSALGLLHKWTNILRCKK